MMPINQLSQNTQQEKDILEKIEKLFRTNNDLILAIHRSFVESSSETDRKMENLRDELNEMKRVFIQTAQQGISDEATKWRSFAENLLSREMDKHNHETTLLTDLLRLTISGLQLKHQQLDVNQLGVSTNTNTVISNNALPTVGNSKEMFPVDSQSVSDFRKSEMVKQVNSAASTLPPQTKPIQTISPTLSNQVGAVDTNKQQIVTENVSKFILPSTKPLQKLDPQHQQQQQSLIQGSQHLFSFAPAGYDTGKEKSISGPAMVAPSTQQKSILSGTAGITTVSTASTKPIFTATQQQKSSFGGGTVAPSSTPITFSFSQLTTSTTNAANSASSIATVDSSSSLQLQQQSKQQQVKHGFGAPPFGTANSGVAGVVPAVVATDKQQQQQLIFGGAVNSSLPTFASMAASKADGGSFLSTSKSTTVVDGKCTPFGAAKDFKIFQQPAVPVTPPTEKGQKSKDDSEGEDEFVPDAHFEPVIPLPNLVEVKTGEEDEEVLFSARCKLFRFDKLAKENKERGVGEMKILFNQNANRYRCVMRRDQVLKICANFPIHAKFRITMRPNMPNIYTWHCLDYSDDTEKGTETTLIGKFKDEEVAKQFVNKLNEICAKLP